MADTLSQLEKQRAARLKGQPYEEKHYKLDGKLVKVSALLYPSLKWYVEEMDTTKGETIPSTRRELDEETGKRLEDWL